MSLGPSTRIGVYEIIGLLGAGGMGEVYRARDTKLGREVALKVLPATVATDANRLARFEREAKTLASLNHPHIAQLYGFEQSGEIAALVMELVEGEDLAERLRRGPLPIDEALPIARQIAEALEAAHDAGIIHRDLKPANIKVRADGTVKVLDFGLAKAVDSGTAINETGVVNVTQSPTITGHGVILGTAAYMAPEQAKGKFVDRRADIWAFGCVLYEMLTGSRAVVGDDLSSTLVALLRDDPRWQMLPADTPPHVRTLLRRCLQKDPHKRLPHISGARMELTDGFRDGVEDSPAPRARMRLAPVAIWALAGALVLAAAGWIAWPRLSTDADPRVVRFSIVPRPGEAFVGANLVPRFAVSRDGKWIVYQTQNGKRSIIWLRAVDALDEAEIAGSESGAGGNTRQQPFWSADGQFIAFFDENLGQLKKLSRQGGATQTLTEITGNQLGGAWNADDVILMASMGTKGIRRVAAAGGAVSQVTTLDESRKEVSHLWPEFLGDEKHFVYLASYSDDTPPALFVSSLDGGPAKRLVESPSGGLFLSPDRLAYVRNGALVAQRFDTRSFDLIGDTTVITDAAAHTGPGRLAASASRNGVLVYGGGSASNDTLETYWVDRTGQPIATPPPSVIVGMSGIRISPDGRQLVFGRAAGTRFGRPLSQFWLQDVTRGIETRLSEEGAFSEATPVFSPDGARVAFQRASPPYALVTLGAAGATQGLELMPTKPPDAIVVFDWSPDGTRILIGEYSTTWKISTVATGGDRTPLTYMDTPVDGGATFSPDGRFVAVTEGSGNTRQVFLRPFPSAADGRWVVSTPGGVFPRWRQDGRELFYLDRDGMVTAVPIRLSPSVEIGTPTPLFQLPIGLNTLFNGFDVMPDGQSFVTLRRPNALLNAARLTVVINSR